MVLSVILDSCVIYPMPLCDTLMRAAEAELYELHFSQEILDGATRNLVNNGRMTNAKERYFQEQIKTNFPDAIVEVPEYLVAAMTNDIGDRHVVAAAIVAKAEVIVTANLKHFTVEALAPYQIEAWHPDDFLVYLDEQHPGIMIKIICQQSNELKRPVTVTESLDKLEKNNRVLKFARSIRCQLYSDEIVQTAKKALNSQFANKAPEGGRCFEGERYRLWQKGEILTITAKDNRSEILRLENGGIGGNLSSADVEAFQIFEKSLEQQLQEAQTEKSQNS
ncbi:PIN domain-containing protein [aff. Roholtiella sp. LEGE 12411]|uniref:PIN domain-containing protein n=1 Tax=aff. Roholtiella sp. LEGE 12411 TaxID=1828822 RepID=UPI001880CBE6|nr:PIN domain-containing protein [aff. Roholtiella sp. LEGE 12411]MBE9035611.1 PIN domain-containing protein [aff. Roholtiella sp. LEGE 12411]